MSTGRPSSTGRTPSMSPSPTPANERHPRHPHHPRPPRPRDDHPADCRLRPQRLRPVRVHPDRRLHRHRPDIGVVRLRGCHHLQPVRRRDLANLVSDGWPPSRADNAVMVSFVEGLHRQAVHGYSGTPFEGSHRSNRDPARRHRRPHRLDRPRWRQLCPSTRSEPNAWSLAVNVNYGDGTRRTPQPSRRRIRGSSSPIHTFHRASSKLSCQSATARWLRIEARSDRRCG